MILEVAFFMADVDGKGEKPIDTSVKMRERCRNNEADSHSGE